ncbi:hypothetical protein KL935_002181 [Ogataea polymorpha]|nr:hypothetical protein KL937_001599 [Ogataea polymorpha]KAG7902221.1 hypothetical protein KL935_002181 [Ogataea polymorpha]KAG7911256.1 hypothetical protein KL906_001636 [Ogataea polymorpha]KAG7918198.1 hypothetical protein KL927_001655 [Ogataea polymorpha]KAG7939066.1 hypothetical protein KL904_001595 [Ogataea polymorpha]
MSRSRREALQTRRYLLNAKVLLGSLGSKMQRLAVYVQNWLRRHPALVPALVRHAITWPALSSSIFVSAMVIKYAYLYPPGSV